MDYQPTFHSKELRLSQKANVGLTRFAKMQSYPERKLLQFAVLTQMTKLICVGNGATTQKSSTSTQVLAVPKSSESVWSSMKRIGNRSIASILIVRITASELVGWNVASNSYLARSNYPPPPLERIIYSILEWFFGMTAVKKFLGKVGLGQRRHLDRSS